MILDHVPQHTRRVVVVAPILRPDRLRHLDLDVVDVSTIPDGLEEAIGEAKDHDVLHGLLAEVMIDAIDLVLPQHTCDLGIEGTCGVEVAPERLLDDHPSPHAGIFAHQTRGAEVAHDLAEEARRHCQVEENVAARAVGSCHLGQQGGQLPVRLGVGELARLVVQGITQFLPQRVVHAHGGEVTDILGLFLAKLLMALWLAGDPHHGQLMRQETVGFEVVESRHQFPLGEVAGRAEDDDRTGAGRSEEPGHRVLGHGARPPSRSVPEIDLKRLTTRASCRLPRMRAGRGDRYARQTRRSGDRCTVGERKDTQPTTRGGENPRAAGCAGAGYFAALWLGRRWRPPPK